MAVVEHAEALWAAVATGAVTVVGAVLYEGWVGRHRRIQVERGTIEPGDESPAVVNLLTHRFKVSREAAAATLIDLADRQVIEIEAVGLGLSLVELRDHEVGDLSAVERHVLDAVRPLAVDGVVPAEACHLGPEELSRAWWRRFDVLVTREAQGQGLLRRGPIGAPGYVLMYVLIPLGGLTLLLANAALGWGIEASLDDGWSTIVAAASSIPLIVAMLVAVRTPAPTAEGRRRAGAWLGARRELAAANLGAHGPAGVQVWGPHAAKAAALGLTPLAVRSLPFGAEDAGQAWSAAGGHWRRVSISYPVWRPGWGRRPSRALVACVLVVVVATSLGLLLLPVEGAPIAQPVAGALLVLAALAALGTAACLVDLTTTRRTTGEVIRLRARVSSDGSGIEDDLHRPRWYLALDDGRAERIRAWSIDEEDHDALSVGQRLTVESTPWLGYLVSYAPAEAVDVG